MIDKSKILELIKKKKLDKFQDDILIEIEKAVNEIIKDKIKSYKNKNRVVKNDDKKEHFFAKEILTKNEIAQLPKWVQDDIDNAEIVGKSKNVILTSDKKNIIEETP